MKGPLLARGWLVTLTGLLLAASALAAQAESTLDSVLAKGQLRVCTTGDYRPFTYFDSAKDHYEGIDIDMANSLAKSLGVKVDFVRTSWPDLMKDFTAGKCDIAMGGISVNLKRQQKAYFSIPYVVDGKTPITLCKNKHKYQTLAQIDRPDVTVIVNPGGTNEHFDREHLKKAKILMFKDNTKIFDELLAGKADLMITDGVETRLQSKLHPKLCAVHPDHPFTYSEKGYLLPLGDNVWKAYVDQWLHQEKASGAFQKVYDHWLK
ncbi:transporter substrate-binding domain-containing protein [Mangrovitalea sediminis]|uniref:transporter substrate-binding domain-containing protein n=1 Tax=Mangrovitalea sediminis TaxID=1982043 RepID=UPI000BE5FC55|nr:transporter substrate-binding domain-containing protein [Mangrovitalea sediminis]